MEGLAVPLGESRELFDEWMRANLRRRLGRG